MNKNNLYINIYKMRMAIIDGINQDIGLKILFPNSDYYIKYCEIDKSKSFKKYNIEPKINWSEINDVNYDCLFVIIALYDTLPNTKFYKPEIKIILDDIMKIIDNNNFKYIAFFDNYDYDYDPNVIINNTKINLFFKRNYNEKINYKDNVKPFPFIMFGEYSIIEKLEDVVSRDRYFSSKQNKIFFSGSLFIHDDPEYKIYRNRQMIYNNISSFIHNPGFLCYDKFIEQLRQSKFALDLLGVGEPNKRTFEILMSGALMLSQKNNLKWIFVEKFDSNTIFENENDFISKIKTLMNDEILYFNCLNTQYNIINRYFNKKYITEYILKFLV